MAPDDPAIADLVRRVLERQWQRSRGLAPDASLTAGDHAYPQEDIAWYWLSLIQHYPADPHASVVERLACPPWDSTDPEIALMWAYITKPEHLPALQRRVRCAVNPVARQATEMAIAQIRRQRTFRDAVPWLKPVAVVVIAAGIFSWALTWTEVYDLRPWSQVIALNVAVFVSLLGPYYLIAVMKDRFENGGSGISGAYAGLGLMTIIPLVLVYIVIVWVTWYHLLGFPHLG